MTIVARHSFTKHLLHETWKKSVNAISQSAIIRNIVNVV